MLCIKTIASPGKPGGAFPCGQCKNCRINRKRLWQARILLHAASWPFSIFLTLTLRDPPDKMGPPHVLQKAHLQNFFKRLRHENIVFSYIAVGEYGERTLRAHYHVLLFSQAPFSDKVLSKRWGLGSIHCGDVQPESIDYVLAYVLKGNSRRRRDDQRPREFRLFSQGIGDASLSELVRSFRPNDGFNFPAEFRAYGKLWPLSRRHRSILADLGWVVSRGQEADSTDLAAKLLLLQGSSYDSEAWQAFLAKRLEQLERQKSRRIRDYYRLAHGHLKGRRNETF